MKMFKLIIERNKVGFWGRIENQEGIYSFGESISDLKTNMHDAIELYFEERSEDVPKFEFELLMDIQEFFIINDFINISTLAKRIGMNSSLLRQYAKGIKFPSIKQVNKIENEIKEIGKQLSRTELQPS